MIMTVKHSFGSFCVCTGTHLVHSGSRKITDSCRAVGLYVTKLKSSTQYYSTHNCYRRYLYFNLTPWPEFEREPYRPRDSRLSAKSWQTLADRGCHTVSVTDPYGRILRFLDRTMCETPIDNTHYAPITTTPSTRTKYFTRTLPEHSHKALH
jgi:hypothetical protein